MNSIMIIAGEASGDLHGANVVRAIKNQHPSAVVFGFGGQHLKAAGVKILIDAAELSVVGISEVFSKLPGIIKGIRTARQLLRDIRPDLLILIDFPDFNLMVAKTAKRFHIPVLYYISPQIWAWRSGRVKKIGNLVDHVAVILPFEAPFYRKHRIPVTFVGHPLLDSMDVPASLQQVKLDSEPVIGLLPGSRESEVHRHLPVMLKAAEILNRTIPNIRFIVSLAPSINRTLMESIIEANPVNARLAILPGGASHVFPKCTLGIAASGTVTLEAALYGLPLVVIYKVSPLSYRIGKAMIRVDYISLANLIAGKELFPELIQDDASPETIANQVSTMLRHPEKLARCRNELSAIQQKLGGPGASQRVAEIALNLMRSRS